MPESERKKYEARGGFVRQLAAYFGKRRGDSSRSAVFANEAEFIVFDASARPAII